MTDPFSRLSAVARWLGQRLRPKPPAMIGPPPSAYNPARHAADFAQRYVTDLERVVSQRMTELGIPDGRIGFPDPDQGGAWCVFFPEGDQGGVVLGNGIGLDGGVLNTDLLKPHDDRRTAALFARSRLRDRIDTIIAHEIEEQRNGFDHRNALNAAPNTDLPIRETARQILRAMKRGAIR